ncbi:hypothetical protein AX14_005675 [Amanita brunnescens Koide BX004]|nr:hypothetical protein AX14_005675 [Amanita brunnescens Koide BX004]
MPTRGFPPFATQEVLDAIALTGNNLAPGPDGISWELLKRAFQVQGAPEGICHLFNCIRSSGCWPTWFKQSLCIIIPKLNKVSYNVPKAFRPISLLNTVGKLLTKCGGVKKHATVDAGVILASFVSESRELGLHSTACAFDISQFFPSLSHKVTEMILRRFGFGEELIRIFTSYFDDRVTTYKWDSATSKSYEFSIGTPQGDCISPILSAIYLAAGIKIATPLPFPPPNVRSLFFVNDSLLYCASKLLRQNAKQIEERLNRIQDVLARLGLFIDADKTELIHFPGYLTKGPARKLVWPAHEPSVNIRSMAARDAWTTVKPKRTI